MKIRGMQWMAVSDRRDLTWPDRRQRAVVSGEAIGDRGEVEEDIADVIDRQRRGPFQVTIISVLVLIMVVEGFDNQVLAYAAPSMMMALGLSKATFGFVFGSSVAGFICGALTLGNLADRHGRRPMVLVGLLTLGISSLLTPLCGSLEQLAVVRFLTGIGVGATIPITNTLAVEFSPRSRRATRIAINYVGHLFGYALSGAVAAFAIPHWGWQSVFIVGGVIPLAAAGVVFSIMPESPVFMLGRATMRPKLLAVLRKLCPHLELHDQTVLVNRERREPGPAAKLLFTHGRAPVTLLLWLAVIGSYVTHAFLTNWLPTVLVAAGLSTARSIAMSSVIPLGAAVGGLLVGRMIDRRGTHILGVSYLIGLAFIIPIGFISLGGLDDVALTALILMIGIFYFGGTVNLNVLAAVIYPSYIRSTGTGWAATIGRVGSFLGVVAGGFLLSSRIPSQALFVVIAVPGFVCALTILMLPRWRKAHARSETATVDRIEGHGRGENG